MTSSHEAPANRWFSRGFVLLCATGFLTEATYWIMTTTLQWQVTKLPGSGPAELGMLYFLQLIPYLVITPFAGAVLDRFNRKLVMCLSIGGVSAVILAGAAFAHAGMLGFGVSAAIAMAVSCFKPFNDAGQHSVLPSTVERAKLPRAVGIYAAHPNVARTIGPVIAGSLLIFTGAPFTLVIGALVAVAALLLISGYPRQQRVERAGGSSVLAQIGGGFVVMWKNPVVRRSIALVALTGLLGLSSASMFSVIVVERFAGGEVEFSLLLAAAGVGAIVGALMPFPRVSEPRHVSILLGVAALGLLAIAIAPTFALVAVGAFFVSAACNSSNQKLNALVQSELTDDVRGRVMSLYVWAWGGSLPLGGLVLGSAGAVIGVSWSILVMAALLCAVALFNMRRIPRYSSDIEA